MTSKSINQNFNSDSESDSGPYIVQLSPERKVRNCFELKKGKFFRTDTVADILDIEPEVIRDLIRKNELSAIKIGKSYRIAESDLQEFLNERYTMKTRRKNEHEK
ncbi:helix-turn-helix domain-containing protein [Methanospirillum hungatei]|uniref:helix-turn-helix domain-containing protein n=1 Tax=Methanospirillum hungatei TaxID=2203 RepID=UPI0026E93B03|nr:helix-turn-helix domain-containing protein [Methanospirillum hungatei]MCA1917330.1 helix-turn-helix domain-containing protein [Methanospirillum hungatei]